MSGADGRTVVVGGSVASLVAADQLAGQGRPVDLHLPETGVGGGFTPVVMGGRRLELGARLIELSYDDELTEPPPLDRYRPGPHGHRPYLALIDSFVRTLAGEDLVALSPPEASVGHRRTTDYVLAGDLSGLADAVDDDRLAVMAAQAGACVAAEGPHGLFAPQREPERWARTYDDVGLAHTGDAFHDLLIAPLAAKILPGGASSVVAALHRKIWMPLFHPVTAWEACTGRLTYRPGRPMWSVANGGMGEIVQRLIQRVEAASTVTVHRSGALRGIRPAGGSTDVELAFEDGSTRVAGRPIVGVGAGELFTAAGIELDLDRVAATMVWVDVRDEEVDRLPSVLFSAEPEVALFRVTESLVDPRPGHRTLCCELDHRHTDPEGWPTLVAEGLASLGVLRAGAAPQQLAGASRPAYPAPSAANQAAFEAARRSYDERALDAVVVGGATTFGADTFNEQVIQGMAAAAAVS